MTKEKNKRKKETRDKKEIQDITIKDRMIIDMSILFEEDDDYCKPKRIISVISGIIIILNMKERMIKVNTYH